MAHVSTGGDATTGTFELTPGNHVLSADLDRIDLLGANRQPEYVPGTFQRAGLGRFADRGASESVRTIRGGGNGS